MLNKTIFSKQKVKTAKYCSTDKIFCREHHIQLVQKRHFLSDYVLSSTEMLIFVNKNVKMF